MTKNTCNERRGPFVELGALHKLLDRLKPDDVECTSAWYSSSEPCCKEIILRFRNLLKEWASDETRVQNCLATDYTLTKCEHCNVIKCVELPQVKENIFMEKKSDDGLTIAEREDNSKLNTPVARPAVSYMRKQEIMRNSHPTVPRHYKSNVPIPLDKLTLRNIHRNAISKKPLPQVSKRNNDNKIINQLHEKNTIGTTPVIVDKSFKEEYRKSTNDTDGVEKYFPPMETARYLVRENFSTKENCESRLPDKTASIRHSCFPKLPIVRNHSFALHGSRDTNIHDNPEFLICDRMRLNEGDSKTASHMVRDDTTTKFDSFDISGSTASYLQPTSGSFHGSDTSAFDCSSADKLIRQWIKPGWNIHGVDEERKRTPGIKNLPPEMQVITTPVIQNVRSIETQIAKDYSVDNNGKSTESSKFNQTSQHCHLGDTLGIEFLEMSNDHELPGISRAMANTMWDEKKISETTSFAVIPKTKNKHAFTDIKSCESSNHQDLESETSECFEREILYDEISSDDVICENSTMTAASKILLTYRKILESNEEMDWESFQHLVSALHPNQRELWRDICKAVSNEAKRLAEETGVTTEVCIELNPLPIEEKRENVECHGDEISFELDMTLKDIQHIVVKNKCTVISKEFEEIHKLGKE